MTADQLPGPLEGTLQQEEKQAIKEGAERDASPAPEQSAADAGIDSCPGEADAESRQASSISPACSPYTPPGSPPSIAPLAGSHPESGTETEPTSATSSGSGGGRVRGRPWRVLLTAENALDIYQRRPLPSGSTDGAELPEDAKENPTQESESGPPRKPPATSLALSSDYGVSVKTIRDIWNRETWVKATRSYWSKEEEEQFSAAQAARRHQATSKVMSLKAAAGQGHVLRKREPVKRAPSPSPPPPKRSKKHSPTLPKVEPSSSVSVSSIGDAEAAASLLSLMTGGW